MSTIDRGSRHEAIRKALANRAGDAPNASAVADATLKTWQHVVISLEPVIGTRGVEVLFSRSLHLTSKAFPWLTATRKDGDSVARLTSLRACLARRETIAAADASNALLATFSELLEALIGESLTARLLSPVWEAPLAPASKTERVS